MCTIPPLAARVRAQDCGGSPVSNTFQLSSVYALSKEDEVHGVYPSDPCHRRSYDGEDASVTATSSADTYHSLCHARLQTWNQGEGRIRLSTDDGPSAHEFLDDDYDDDNERVGDSEPLAITAERLRRAAPPPGLGSEPVAQPTVLFEADADADTEEPPPLPPKH